MNYKIDTVHASEYPAVVDLWEASVRATHHFLKDEDIAFFRPLILNDFLKAVKLACVRTEKGKIVGFMGVAVPKLEMLFVHPDERGNGIGKMLLQYATRHLNVTQVDVNEDNQQAVGFYVHAGFKVVKRSELDSMGKPYPILHMEL